MLNMRFQNLSLILKLVSFFFKGTQTDSKKVSVLIENFLYKNFICIQLFEKNCTRKIYEGKNE